jgi:hypothetical protein
MTYSKAIQFLQSLQTFVARFGLETTRTWLNALGIPKNNFALFTAPHLISFHDGFDPIVNSSPRRRSVNWLPSPFLCGAATWGAGCRRGPGGGNSR